MPAAAAFEVTVPATSANLGAGYDSFGLALDLRDEVTASLCVEPVDPVRCVEVEGEGEGSLPGDRSHLVHRIASTVLAERGLADLADRLLLHCLNRIPQSRGMGSSASAVVAGISIADALSAGAGLPEPPAAEKLAWATRFEGHPDNAAPALYGGVSVSYADAQGRPQSASIPVDPRVSAALVIPSARLDTAVARSLIPATVPHAQAAANSAVAGLFVHAISSAPELLFDATADRLHQEFRRPAMPEALARVDALRAAGLAAVVSGAGPTVLVLGTGGDLAERTAAALPGDDARVRGAQISEAGATTTALSPAPGAV
ncbi:homoserine kinase [Brevibacterium sp. 5221]|uniref:Homoserine kinase n=1 Tax=Brevibacterium rongguiense TaxID=2695267 RepID=A0A6N9H688_9MICO|nr:homoserine kinase [Brevibacterium rongguiense]MYM19415.1 homoserine kinase [Brevibacterium rongguiense]